MEIREYTRKDRLACLRVLDSNIPGFLKPDARDDFTDYLDELGSPGHYFFVLENYTKQILACGGVFIFPDTALARFNWDMVARAHHRTGLGRAMIEFRLDWLKTNHQNVKQVILESNSFSSGFFELFGFTIEQTSENHYGKDLHRFDMRLTL